MGGENAQQLHVQIIATVMSTAERRGVHVLAPGAVARGAAPHGPRWPCPAQLVGDAPSLAPNIMPLPILPLPSTPLFMLCLSVPPG